MVGYNNAELLDIAGVATPLAMTNYFLGRRLYDVVLATPDGAAITCTTGLVVGAQGRLETLTGPLDTLVVAGGLGHGEAASDRRLVAHVRRLAQVSRRVASVCTGADVLAAAGLLDGRRAATHWGQAAELGRLYPQVTFDPRPIFIRDGNIATSAGVTASLDLTLSFVEEDTGSAVARKVARFLVTYLQRPGNQAQMSVFTSAPAPANDLVRETVDYVVANLEQDLSGPTLAARVGVSERHLSRLFVQELGQSPGRYVRTARVHAAAHFLTGTTLTIEGVASRCGYGTAESLRQAFVATYGVSPSHYRATCSSTGWPEENGSTSPSVDAIV